METNAIIEGRPPRVLVVEDERHVRGLLCELLSIWGCEADSAADASQALSLFDQGDYDLVLTDHSMPGVTGLELVERVRTRDPRVGVIMLTATPLDVSAHEARLGFRLLRKPLAVPGLERAVREALAAR